MKWEADMGMAGKKGLGLVGSVRRNPTQTNPSRCLLDEPPAPPLRPFVGGLPDCGGRGKKLVAKGKPAG